MKFMWVFGDIFTISLTSENEKQEVEMHRVTSALTQSFSIPRCVYIHSIVYIQYIIIILPTASFSNLPLFMHHIERNTESQQPPSILSEMQHNAPHPYIISLLIQSQYHAGMLWMFFFVGFKMTRFLGGG